MDCANNSATSRTELSSQRFDINDVNDNSDSDDGFRKIWSKNIFSSVLQQDRIKSGLFGAFPEEKSTAFNTTGGNGIFGHGDEESPVEVDVDREVVRMESLEVYILVAELTSIAAFTTIQSIVQPSKGIITSISREAYIEELVFYYLITFFSAFSAISGLYATGIFSLTVLYGKTALGINRDQMYRIFVERTAKYRIRGFRAFTASLLCFSLQILSMTCKKIRGPIAIRVPLSILAACFTFIIFHDWDSVMKIATPIFTNKLPDTPECEKLVLQLHEQKKMQEQQQIDKTIVKGHGRRRRRISQEQRIQKAKSFKRNQTSSESSGHKLPYFHYRNNGNSSNTRTKVHFSSSSITNDKHHSTSMYVRGGSRRRLGVSLGNFRQDSASISTTRSSNSFRITDMSSTEFPTPAQRFQQRSDLQTDRKTTNSPVSDMPSTECPTPAQLFQQRSDLETDRKTANSPVSDMSSTEYPAPTKEQQQTSDFGTTNSKQ